MAGVLLPRGGPAPMGGQMMAEGPLARALDSQAAGEAGPVRIDLSFRDRNGRYCRTFATDAMSGPACREAGDWTIELAARRPKAQGGEYRTAASETAAPVLTLVDEMIAGEPLDAAQEAAAREGGWR